MKQFTYKETKTRFECVERKNGFDENTPLEFHSPYGCSKGAADQYMLDYARIFGLKTVVFRHSSMYGGRQFSTYDQGWVGWFCQKAIEAKNGTADPDHEGHKYRGWTSMHTHMIIEISNSNFAQRYSKPFKTDSTMSLSAKT